MIQFIAPIHFKDLDSMIQSYHFGFMEVDGITHRRDLKIIHGKVVGDWRRSRGHYLSRSDLTDVLAAEPEIVVVGTGAYGAMQVSSELIQLMEARRIHLMIQPTAQAVLSFNRHHAGNRDVAAAFHLTC